MTKLTMSARATTPTMVPKETMSELTSSLQNVFEANTVL